MFDWITVILILLIIGIILDGVRRVRASRRSSIKLSRNAQKADIEWGSESPQAQSEFPSGGPRVVGYREESEAREHTENIKNNFQSNRVTLGTSSKIPEQVSLNLEESVPMLMESIELQAQHDSEKKQVDVESTGENVAGEFPSELDASAEPVVSKEEHASEITQTELDGDKGFEPSIGSLDELDTPDESDYLNSSKHESPVNEQPRKESFSERIHKKIDAFTSDRKNESNQESFDSNSNEKYSQENKRDHSSSDDIDDDKEQTEYVEPDEVLIVNIMAHPGEQFAGELLLSALMQEGMKLGNMDIFHRHHENNGDAPVVFSLANMVMPGTFNLAKMSEFSTPGVSLFLGLPVVGDSLAAYNDLVATAQRVADAIDGELKDENRSVMTKQTIEHGKQRVIEYERKKKLARV